MSKPTKAHLTTAQRIYDRLGRGSVADIDAIAQALAEAERGGERNGIREGKRQARQDVLSAAYHDERDSLVAHASITDESE